MFENKRDTMLLQGALLSAACTNSGSLLNCEALENPLSILCNSVKKIINYNIASIKDEKKRIQTQLDVDKRLHAAIFFTTLKSHNLTSISADAFYSSIVGSWPPIDLKFYIELSYRCDWSEYFINCASQLQSESMIRVLKLILSIQFSSEVEKYCWHLVLQTLVIKLLDVPEGQRKECAFHFGFSEKKFNKDQLKENTEMSEDINIVAFHKQSEGEVVVLKDFCNDMCDRICSQIDQSNSTDLIKILLHATKTILRNLHLESHRNYENTSNFSHFVKFFNTLNGYLKSDSSQELLKISLNNSTTAVNKHSYALVSWNISESYLCFLLYYYAKQLNSDSNSGIHLSSSSKDVYSELIPCILLYEEVNALNPLFAECSQMTDANLNYLLEIMLMNFEGASYIAEMFLSKPNFLERNNTLKVLEDNSHVIDFMKVYSLILHCVKFFENDDFKCRLLNIFYKLLLSKETSVYNDVIVTILSEYGFTEEFELPDFSEQLSLCFRSAPTVNEAEDIFPILFVQNPLVLLKRTIDQTLIQGIDGEPYIRPLKYVPFVCIYRNIEDELPTLIGLLNDYFEKEKLEPWETKNMVALYKFLMKLQAEDNQIMDLDVFFNECIIPKLLLDSTKIELILECVHASLTILIKGNSFSVEHETLISFVISLGRLLNDCIIKQNGRVKLLVLSVIKEIVIHQETTGAIKDEDKIKLWSILKSLHEIVSIYLKEFIPEDIKFNSLSYTWISFCQKRDITVFEELIVNYPLSSLILQQTFLEVLPHLTKEEWMSSIDLIKVCFKNQILREEMLSSWISPFPLSEAESEAYAVASCLIACLHFILQENKNPIYIISCFAHSLITFLGQEKSASTNLLLTVLLDCCHLIECVSPDISSLITLVLLDLKKSVLTSISDKIYKEDCKGLLSFAINCLPSYCDKSVLLNAT